MHELDLGGEWTLSDSEGEHRCAATVPGTVHQDLLAAGVIDDLAWRDNERKALWVGERDWTLRRTFTVDERLLGHDRVVLACDGLDTLATVTVNGQVVLEADNMFRRWEVDVRAALRAGENEIEVAFRSPLPEMERRQAEFPLPAWNLYHERFRGKSWIRKMACAFGWDWGVIAVTQGIWRAIALRGYDHARLGDVRVDQRHDDGVTLAVDPELERWDDASLRLEVAVAIDGASVASTTTAGIPAELAIPEPRLWWPNGMGEQPLYEVTVVLRDGDGGELDRWTGRIGLRTVRIHREPDQWGESFGIAVNGVRVFAKGANWIPADVLVPRLTDDDYARLLGDAQAAHMNCIRLWGGGIYEQEAFYRECDERGLLIWHDFMFACSTYPTFDKAWLANVEAELVDNVRKLRHHASIALWCGNNELEQGLVRESGWDDHSMSWGDYSRLFDQLLPEIVARHDGERDYWPCSPHSPHGNRRDHNNPECGDAHCWTVWFGGQPFEAQRDWTHRFMSEFGFQSFPEPRTVASFTEPGDRNLCSRIMDFHQRSKNRGNKTIYAYLLDWFRVPRDFDESLWLTQLTQALCIQYAAEHSRHLQPRMEGCVYWQLNDLWPAPTWSSIDVHGRWKALQYLAKRFFEPVLVAGVERCRDGTVTLFGSNHTPADVELEVRWRATDCRGEELAAGSVAGSAPAQAGTELGTVDLQAIRRRFGDADVGAHELRGIGPDGVLGYYAGDCDLLVWLEGVVDGAVVSRNLTLFARPKHLELQDPGLRVDVEQVDGGFVAVVEAERPALWVRLELVDRDARFADNFLHLQAGQPRRVPFAAEGDLDAIRGALRATSLYHTYTGGAAQPTGGGRLVGA